MTVPIEVQIMAHDMANVCANEPDFEKRCRKALLKAAPCDFWMLHGDGPKEQDLCFRSAIAAVLLDPLTTEEEKGQITNTLEQLRALSGLLTGLPMDVEAMAARSEKEPPLPLMAWWHDARKAVGK